MWIARLIIGFQDWFDLKCSDGERLVFIGLVVFVILLLVSR